MKQEREKERKREKERERKRKREKEREREREGWTKTNKQTDNTKQKLLIESKLNIRRTVQVYNIKQSYTQNK